MKFSTLIPFYLWKNTFRRWFEYPVSPISKALIPAMLGIMALVVLTLFAGIERELREELARSSAFSVFATEFVSADRAAELLEKSYEEELLWTARYGSKVRQLKQPMTSATWRAGQRLQIYAYSAAAGEIGTASATQDHPVVWLVSQNPAALDSWNEVRVAGVRATARSTMVPSWMVGAFKMEQAVLAPIEMVQPILTKGFIIHTVARFDTLEEVEHFVGEMSAYTEAERRHVKIISAMEILKNLERLTMIQNVVRSLIIMGCGVLLALMLGSIAWLEYRQDAYLLALLRSFGTPSRWLLFHAFLENLLLVFCGLAMVHLAWSTILRMAIPFLKSLGLQSASGVSLPAMDFAVVFLAGLVGVCLAMVPVALGLRKPPGLLLQ